MTVYYHANFWKAYRQRIANDGKLVQKTKERTQLFLSNPGHPLLMNHILTGKHKNKAAFSVTGDIRIIYTYESAIVVKFLDIGTHNQVY